MSKTMMTTAFAALLAAAAPAAMAQTAATTTPATAHTGTAATHITPGQIRVTQMDGATVYDTQNRNIGDVKDIILERDGKVAAVVLDVGSFLGMGGKFVAVAMNDLKVTFDKDNNKPHFAVDMTKEQLKAAQNFDLNEKKASTGTSTPPARTTR